MSVPRSASLCLLLACPLALQCQAAPAPADAQTTVARALANELRAARDTGHPMRYQLLKTSPRLSSIKLMIETRDGVVARLVAINNQPLSAVEVKKEQDRLDSLLSDPGKQRHRKQSEEDDAARAMKVLRALPKAFLYQYVSTEPARGTKAALVKFEFKPNPAFNPPNMETQALTVMTGEIWIDSIANRVVHLEGHLEDDVDYGWGLLGRLNKGGSIVIEQDDVGGGQWHVVRFTMKMTGRVLFKAKVFDTTEVESSFAPVDPGMTYQKGIDMLEASAVPAAPAAPQ